jgi:hypothetical protein
LGGYGKKAFHKPPQALARKRYKSVASEKNSVEITRFEIKKFTKILAES